MPFTFTKMEIPDVLLIEPKAFGDERGFFVETYKKSDFVDAGISEEFVQDNHSKSAKGVLRGLHYQLPPFAQAKIIRCIQGEIWDVAVDIRKGSPTYGKWVAETLTAENKKMLYIPTGFAHGFLTLRDNTEIVYKVSAEYSPECDRSIQWNDPTINVQWPTTDNVILSGKDQGGKLFVDAEVF